MIHGVPSTAEKLGPTMRINFQRLIP